MAKWLCLLLRFDIRYLIFNICILRLVSLLFMGLCVQGSVCAGYTQDSLTAKLMESLQDDNHDIREEAANALVKIGPGCK